MLLYNALNVTQNISYVFPSKIIVSTNIFTVYVHTTHAISLYQNTMSQSSAFV